MDITSEQVNAVLRALRETCSSDREAASVLVATYVIIAEKRQDNPSRETIADEIAGAIRTAIIKYTPRAERH
jgi:hypothetical protein